MTVRATTVLLITALLLMPSPGLVPSACSRLRHKPPDLPAPPVLPDQVPFDTAGSIGKYIAGHIEEFATPEFKTRKRTRREFQRAGYTNILHDILALDAVSALLAFVRTRLQIEYSLPHNTIYFPTDTGALWPLPEDWAFPTDPWTD